MSRSLNKIMIIGNVGAIPEIRTTTGGTTVASFTVATNEQWKNRDGSKGEHTEWHNCDAFGGVADVVKNWVHKGDRIYVEGSLRTDKWTDREGKDRYTTKVRVQNVILLGGKPQDGGGQAPSGGYDAPPDLNDNDIPF